MKPITPEQWLLLAFVFGAPLLLIIRMLFFSRPPDYRKSDGDVPEIDPYVSSVRSSDFDDGGHGGH